MKVKFILIASFLFTIACKKENVTAEPPPSEPSVNQALLQDGPLSAQLGKLIYLGNHGFSRATPYWGRNSDELFITASTEILRLDLAAQNVEVVEKSVGLVTGKTNENSGIVFLSQLDYYVFEFSSNKIEHIISVPYNQGTILNIAGNTMFFYLAPVTTPNPPCSGFCWTIPGTALGTLYHIDKQTQQKTELKNKRFILFSPDGSMAILSSQLESRIYMFDNNSRTITDSSDLNIALLYTLFFQGSALQSFEADVLGNITIKDFNTNQVLRQFQTAYVALDNFVISRDGTKLYYSGGILNGNSLKILLYDIATNTEKTIAELPFLEGGGLPFETFVLSDDNKKMVVQAGNGLYLKVLE